MTSFKLPALALVCLAVPAHAQVDHKASFVHEGRTVTVSYQPKAETTLRQTGVGPREATRCFWKTRVSVERIALDAAGQPIAALTRAVGSNVEDKGMRIGVCAAVSPRDTAAFGGNDEKMRRHLAAAAEADRQQLRMELASIGAARFVDAR
mgnify:CR=1 FL=1